MQAWRETGLDKRLVVPGHEHAEGSHDHGDAERPGYQRGDGVTLSIYS
jgi:hypothetical protein